MLRLCCFLVLWFCSQWVWSQNKPIEIPLNSSTVFKDVAGQRISFETFLEYTSGRDYEMNPVFDENNELKEVIVVKASIAATREAIDPSEFANTVELIDQIPPDFEGVDLQGNFYNMENLQGKVLVLKFWFKACQPCVDEMPELNQLVQQYRHQPDVVFLAPCLDQAGLIHDFLLKHPFDYAIIPNARNIAHTYNVPGYPTHVVIGRNGKVKTVYLGVNHRIGEKLSRAIEYELNQKEAILPTAIEPDPPAIEEEELFISPASIIKNEAGEVVPFDRFIVLMAQNQYQLLSQKDEQGQAYVLMKVVEH